ncbi:hypothetical protein QTP88_025592 [Uroleucon formosanum]
MSTPTGSNVIKNPLRHNLQSFPSDYFGPIFILVESTDTEKNLVKITFDSIENGNVYLNSVFLTEYGFSASIPSNLIYSFGVIKLDTDLSEADFHEGLSSLFPIESFRCITVNKDGITPTRLVELKFISPRLPQHIIVFNMIFEVSPSVRSPVQCNRCLRFGHNQKCCRRCSHCGGVKHFIADCPTASATDSSCLFCHLPHLATDRSCHEWSVQKDIKKIMTIENISYQDAIIFKKNKCSSSAFNKTISVGVEEELGVGSSTDIKFRAPRKRYSCDKPITELDDFDCEVVRRVVYSFYDKGEFPTSVKILAALREKIDYRGSKSSVKIILKKLNFKYKKCNDGRKFLMERSDIVAARVKFVRKMNKLRTNGDTQPVVYLDETWVNQNHTRGRIWQNHENTEGLKVPTGKDSRLIICHAGSPSFSFVKYSKLIVRCNSGNNRDYHSQMNATIFKKLFLQMLMNLEEPSIIVMDNASYNFALLKDYPKSNSRKADVQQWLRDKNIDFSPVETLDELRAKVKLAMLRGKIYKLDRLTHQMGHEVVRLPPYHCQYNPIELIWAQFKGRVAEKNSTFKIADVEALVNKEIDAITADDWAQCGEHCAKPQEDDFHKAGLRDEILDPIILTIYPDDSSSSHDDDDDEE